MKLPLYHNIIMLRTYKPNYYLNDNNHHCRSEKGVELINDTPITTMRYGINNHHKTAYFILKTHRIRYTYQDEAFSKLYLRRVIVARACVCVLLFTVIILDL